MTHSRHPQSHIGSPSIIEIVYPTTKLERFDHNIKRRPPFHRPLKVHRPLSFLPPACLTPGFLPHPLITSHIPPIMPFFDISIPAPFKAFVTSKAGAGTGTRIGTSSQEQAPRRKSWTKLGRSFAGVRKHQHDGCHHQRRHSIQELGGWATKRRGSLLPVSGVVALCGRFLIPYPLDFSDCIRTTRRGRGHSG